MTGRTVFTTAVCSMAALFAVIAVHGADLEAARRARSALELDRAQRMLSSDTASFAERWELGWLYWDCLDVDLATQTFEALAEWARRDGDGPWIGRARCMSARSASMASKYAAARVALDEAARALPSPRGPEDAALLGYAEAAVDFDCQRDMQGLSQALEAAGFARAAGSASLEARCFLLMGEFGSFAQRRTSLLRAVDLAERGEAGPLECRARLALARHERVEGRSEEALERLVPVAERLQPGRADRLIFQIRREEGLARQNLDRWAGAIRSFVLARNAAERLADPIGFAEVTAPLIVCCRERNIIDRARTYAAEATAKLAGLDGDVVDRLRSRITEAVATLPQQ